MNDCVADYVKTLRKMIKSNEEEIRLLKKWVREFEEE